MNKTMSSGMTICLGIIIAIALWPVISIFISAGAAIAVFIGTIAVLAITIMVTVYGVGYLYEKARGRTPEDIVDRVKNKYEEVRDCLKNKDKPQ